MSDIRDPISFCKAGGLKNPQFHFTKVKKDKTIFAVRMIDDNHFIFIYDYNQSFEICSHGNIFVVEQQHKVDQ